MAAPPCAEVDDFQKTQSGERSEHPEGGGVTHEHPEFPPLGDRGICVRAWDVAH